MEIRLGQKVRHKKIYNGKETMEVVVIFSNLKFINCKINKELEVGTHIRI